MARKFISKNLKENILCITYTNRAAKELAGDLKFEHIFVGTIYSFFRSFIQRYFAHSDILRLYFDRYGEPIKQRIENVAGNAHIAESNEKYKEKFGQLDYETVQKHP